MLMLMLEAGFPFGPVDANVLRQVIGARESLAAVVHRALERSVAGVRAHVALQVLRSLERLATIDVGTRKNLCIRAMETAASGDPATAWARDRGWKWRVRRVLVVVGVRLVGLRMGVWVRVRVRMRELRLLLLLLLLVTNHHHSWSVPV